jgi:hypothetical protein
MSISGLPRILVRRWYATLVGLLVTVAVGIAAVSLVPATYEAKASTLLLPPKTAGSNPYLELGGLEGVADVLTRAVTDTTTQDSLTSRGLTGTYKVVRDQTASGPVVLVTADAKTPSGAIATMRVVDHLLGPNLQKLQTDVAVPTKALMTTRLITADDTASTVRKTQTRALIGAVAVGLLLTVLLAAGAENLASRRARKRASRAQDATVAVEPAAVKPTDVHQAAAEQNTATPTGGAQGSPRHGTLRRRPGQKLTTSWMPDADRPEPTAVGTAPPARGVYDDLPAGGTDDIALDAATPGADDHPDDDLAVDTRSASSKDTEWAAAVVAASLRHTTGDQTAGGVDGLGGPVGESAKVNGRAALHAPRKRGGPVRRPPKLGHG